jgi:hypothetical protein
MKSRNRIRFGKGTITLKETSRSLGEHLHGLSSPPAPPPSCSKESTTIAWDGRRGARLCRGRGPPSRAQTNGIARKAARRWRALPRASSRAGKGPDGGATISSSDRHARLLAALGVAKIVWGREQRKDRGRWGATGACSGAAVASLPEKATTAAACCSGEKKWNRS